MRTLLAQMRARPHLLLSAGAGAIVAWLAPLPAQAPPSLLLGWNVAVWLYLAQAFWIMSRADHHHLRRTAVAQAEGHGVVLLAVIAAAVASLAAIGVELSSAKGAAPQQALPRIAFALVTVIGAWLLLPTLFALSYASTYFARDAGPADCGLVFPGDPKAPRRYWDFLYFSFTIAVASQTADVAITHSTMRRTVLIQSLLSFAFNTAILALTINIAAGLI
ncbi:MULTISPECIES: DUF1345 domain-containing protein [unclassified Rhizobacter]|uniref:DUF1345 domain-containing protein n=1 Tax=unclassified Rhizobacter TaxID=2640088 RepID=UPI0006F94355|nr:MULTISPECIES: DUF1345 domain-containing protein [unclassified Rhizobacter]KQU80407.1 hypothetical protein ASC88_17450 [Rhizobacter sp. Root29]KQW13905.1 hypothetical protein ASC98_17580 [Rhizobacter sp. Root1238]KRB15729.1 hypothetical protein ASE08_26700 [Rhizobacter sp. Root16D2]